MFTPCGTVLTGYWVTLRPYFLSKNQDLEYGIFLALNWLPTVMPTAVKAYKIIEVKHLDAFLYRHG